MTLNQVIRVKAIAAGGLGSGCHGPNCGRKPGPLTPADTGLLETKDVFHHQHEFPPEEAMAGVSGIEEGRGGFSGKVKLKDLVPTQMVLGKDKVAWIAKHWDKSQADKLLVIRHNGKDYLYDGHHRAAAAIQKGETEARAKIYVPYDEEDLD